LPLCSASISTVRPICRLQHANKIVGAGDRDSIKRQDDVAGHQPGPFGGLPGSTVAIITALLGEVTACRRRESVVLGSDADIGTPHAAMARQFAQYETGVFAATAKQMPCAPTITAVLMPTTSPCDERAGRPNCRD
jgi:hypothetical protein